MWLIWRQDQYSISVDRPSPADIKTGALSKEDISIVSAKTVKTSNRKPVRAAAAAASTRFQESDSSDFGKTRKRQSKKNKPKPTK
jgi:hypothetical protein